MVSDERTDVIKSMLPLHEGLEEHFYEYFSNFLSPESE